MKNLTIVVVACAALSGACSKSPTPPPEPVATEQPAPPTDQERPARLLPLPGETPRVAGGSPHAAGLVWDVPAEWEEQAPSSAMRRAQYRVPGPDGDGECIVYYFGPGQGGDPAANAMRWAGQFKQPDGRRSNEVMQVSLLEGGRIPVQLVEVTGTYDGGMTMTDAPAEDKTGYMLMGAIAEGTDAPWFFKFTGPESTIRAQRASFVRMMESLRAGS